MIVSVTLNPLSNSLLDRYHELMGIYKEDTIQAEEDTSYLLTFLFDAHFKPILQLKMGGLEAVCVPLIVRMAREANVDELVFNVLPPKLNENIKFAIWYLCNYDDYLQLESERWRPYPPYPPP